MSAAISPVAGNANILTRGQFQFYTVTEHGITFNADTPRDSWLAAVQQLCGMFEGAVLARERTLMLLADSLNFGEATYGEEFAQAIDATRQALGLTPKTIANAQWCYKAIEASRRREGLTLSHYSVVAALPVKEQERYLDQAIADHMTVSALKKEVAGAHPKTKRGKERKAKAEKVGDISNMTEAKAAATALSNYLTEHEEKIKAGPLLDVMGHISKLFRRITDKGRKR